MLFSRRLSYVYFKLMSSIVLGVYVPELLRLDYFTSRHSTRGKLHPFDIFDFEHLKFPTLFKLNKGIERHKASKNRRLDDNWEFVLRICHIFAIPESHCNVQIWIIDQSLRSQVIRVFNMDVKRAYIAVLL